MSRRIFYVGIGLFLLGLGIFVNLKLNENSLALIESLPATFRTQRNRDQIVILRLLPSPGNRKRNLSILQSRFIVESIEYFDANGCEDIGDREISFLAAAPLIECVGLDGTRISDATLKKMLLMWPKLQFLKIENCNVTQDAVLDVINKRKLIFIHISEELNTRSFRDRIREQSPNTIVMCGGDDVMDQPESAFERIPWEKWN